MSGLLIMSFYHFNHTFKLLDIHYIFYTNLLFLGSSINSIGVSFNHRYYFLNMATVTIPVQPLRNGQTIEEWRRCFVSSVALLKEEQAISLLPMYVCRNRSEQLLAEVAAKKEKLDEALDELQLLIDGETSPFTWMDRFCSAKPDDPTCTASLLSFFYELMSFAEKAGIPHTQAVIRYLNVIPKGEQVYTKIKSSVKDSMTAAEVNELFRVIRPMLEPERNEPITEVFLSNSTTDEVADLKSQLAKLSKQFNEAFGTPGSETESLKDESEAYFQKRGNHKKTICKICKKKGHESAACFHRVCEKCEGKGHDADVCPSKGKLKKTVTQR